MSDLIDVPLPDGTVIRNVPRGTTHQEILSRLKAAGKDTSWAETKQVSGAEDQAKNTGVGEAILVGAGRKVDQILNGLTQGYLYAKGDAKALGGLAQNEADARSTYNPLQLERPYATGFGEALPSMAVPGAGASLGGALAAGALPEVLAYGSPMEKLKRGTVNALGAATGYGVGKMVSMGLKPAGVGTSVNREAIDAAERIGYHPLAGEATQNKALLNMENYLSRAPGASGGMQRLTQANRDAVNEAAAKSIGVSGTDISPALLRGAEKSLGAEYQRLQQITAPKLGNDFFNSLVDIESANIARGPFRVKAIDSLIDKGMDLAAKGNLSGTAYKEIHTQLADQATTAFNGGDATLGRALTTIRKSLDDAAKQSLGKADQEAWDAVRAQWANWKTLTKGAVVEAGNVSPARVAQSLRGQGTAFRTGKTAGELTDIAKIGEGFKQAQNPNSGNIAHTVWGSAVMPANWLAQKVYTNPVVQSYLREGLVDIGPRGEMIMKATGVPVGIDALNSYLGTP
jgi:hypothetical protein